MKREKIEKRWENLWVPATVDWSYRANRFELGSRSDPASWLEEPYIDNYRKHRPLPEVFYRHFFLSRLSSLCGERKPLGPGYAYVRVNCQILKKQISQNIWNGWFPVYSLRSSFVENMAERFPVWAWMPFTWIPSQCPHFAGESQLINTAWDGVTEEWNFLALQLFVYASWLSSRLQGYLLRKAQPSLQRSPATR